MISPIAKLSIALSMSGNLNRLDGDGLRQCFDGAKIVWETSQGIRTLCGAEAYLVRELIHYLHDQILVGIEIGEPHFSNVSVFDSLQPTQQLAMLHTVARGLLDSSAAPPKLTATCEGTIYAIFRELETLIEAELDFEQQLTVSDHRLRSLARDAWIGGCQQSCEDTVLSNAELAGYAIPDLNCTDMEQWADFIESIADHILWDRDFEFEKLVGDAAPDQAEVIKQRLGINDDYFSTIASDVREIDVERMSAQIRLLTPATEFASPYGLPEAKRNIA